MVQCKPQLGSQDNRIMETDDYSRKKQGECKDHAVDGKKTFDISDINKTDIVIRDLGRAAMDEEDLNTSQILITMLSITDDELQIAGNISSDEFTAL
jgi:RNA polymerase-interacting CarD/CdnL/TRCF family regulator